MHEELYIRDKRRFDTDGNLKEEYPERPREESKSEQTFSEPDTQHIPSGESDFISLLMSLSAMAQNAMGLGPDSPGASLEDAQYFINIIGVLEEKTRGNLTLEEEQTLRRLLYELRMNFAGIMERVRPQKSMNNLG
jgi:hypothetical protein